VGSAGEDDNKTVLYAEKLSLSLSLSLSEFAVDFYCCGNCQMELEWLVLYPVCWLSWVNQCAQWGSAVCGFDDALKTQLGQLGPK